MYQRGRNEKQDILNQLINRPHQQIGKKQNQMEMLELLNRKDDEIKILNEVNSRLGAELAVLQKKLGIDHDIILKQLENLGEISVAFHFQTQQLVYLDHLLKAYDQNTIRQKKLIALLYSELEDSDKKSQNLVKENQFLLSQLQQKSKQILQIYNKGFPEDNLMSAYTKLQIESQNERIMNMKQQSQYLVSNFNDLQVKHQKVITQLDEANKVAQKYFEKFKSQTEQLKDAQMKVDDLLKIKLVLQKKFDEISQENIQLSTSKHQLENKVSKLQNDYKQVKNQLLATKKNERQQIQKLGIQIDTLKLESDSSQKRQKQLFQKNMSMERELENVKDNYRKNKRDLEKIRSDFQQTLKMCQAYEIKINHFSKKQQAMKMEQEQFKEKLDNVILEREKLSLKQQQLQRLIENLNSKHRDEMNTLKTTFEKIINSQNQKIKVLQDSREEFQSTFSHQQLTFRNQIDKLKRENQLLKQQNNKFIHNFKSSSENEIVAKIKDLQARNESLARTLQQKDKILREETEHKEEIIRSLQNENRDLSRQMDRARNETREAINDRTQYRSKISILEKQKECLEDQITRLKKNLDHKHSNNEEERDWKIKQLQQKLSQAVLKQKNTRQKAIEMLQKYDEAEQKIKLQYQKRILELQDENKRLRNRR